MLLLTVARWLDRREREVVAYLMEENRVLRRQLGGRRLRLTDDDRRKLAARAYRLGRQALREVATIVTPDTLLRWHRQLIARKWTYARKGMTRRGVLAEIRQLVGRMAEENPTWGYTRIQGALKNLGHRVGRSTIARILRAHGLPPAPERPTSWQTFLRAHWGAIAAADFFTTEVWTWRGLVTFYTVFVIELASRRVQILGSTPHPDEAFMWQIVRNLTLADAGGFRAADLRPGCEVECGGAGALGGHGAPRHPDAVSGAECKCLRRTVRPVDQGGMSESPDSVRRTSSSAGRRRVCRPLSSRAESPRFGQRTD